MAYTTADARQGLLDTVAAAIEQLGVALSALGEAYEQLDERSAERLEEQLFRPVQLAYGRAQRTYASFAERHRLDARSFAPAPAGAPSTGVRGFIDEATQAAAAADADLAELQDSMLPVEVGDAELRDGLREVRELLGELDRRARRVHAHAGALARCWPLLKRRPRWPPAQAPRSDGRRRVAEPRTRPAACAWRRRDSGWP